MNFGSKTNVNEEYCSTIIMKVIIGLHMNRSEKAGKLLASILLQGGQGNRWVVVSPFPAQLISSSSRGFPLPQKGVLFNTLLDTYFWTL